ncbi:protein kinase [bacterium]|nr:protein kinase [candidate division CSSED10-310 bacterium]
MINVAHIDRFKVIKVIGQGGQGEVIHVRDTDQTDYALKWLLPYVVNQGSTDRFLREFQSIRALSHPNVIRVFEQGQFLNRPYFTMELVSGENLEQFIDKEKNFDVYYDILIQISSALGFIHDHRLVHRDIKPSNVLVDSKGFIKLMDFGLVKNLDASIQLTQVDKFFGTMSYASPEQLLGEKVDYRSDLYSLGILIYRMFSSRLPFHGESMVAIITKHLSVVPKPLKEIVPNCSPVLSDLCDRLLMKSPLDRTLTAADVAATIRTINSGKKISVRQPTLVRDRSIHRLQLRFHGRDRELQSLLRSLDQTGNFSIQLICGEQGIGKSRLVNEAVRESLIAGNHRKVIRCSGQSRQQDNNRSSFFHFIANEIEAHIDKLGDLKGILPEIAPLHPAFQRFDPTHSAPDPSPGRGGFRYKIRYLSALVAQLTQAVPWHIIWEDLHQANAFEIECLSDLIDLSYHQPVQCCIWATIRTDDFITSQDFNAFVADFQPENHSDSIILKPLESVDAQIIIASVINMPRDAGIVNQIVEYCQGNPSILLQTIQHWIDNGNLIDKDGHISFAHSTDSRETVGPIGLQDIARQRLSTLSKESLELLTWIATLDQDAYLEVIRHGLQFAEKELMKRLNDMLFHSFITSHTDSAGERYTVSNPVLKSMILTNAGSDRIRGIHAETVGIMELLGGHYANPVLLSRHQEKAGEIENSCKSYYKAASDAYSNNQLLAAHDLMSNAHRLLQSISMDSKANQLLKIRVLILYSKILLNTGTMDENQRLIPELKDLLQSIRDVSMKSDIYHFAITTLTYSFKFDESKRWLQEFETVLQMESVEKGARYFQLHAMLSFFERDYDEANRNWKKALIIRKSTGAPPEELANSLFMLAKTLTATGRYKASLQLLRHAFKLIPKGYSLRTQAMLLSEMGNVAFYQNQTKTALSYLERSRSINDTLGLKYSKACNLHDLALCHHQFGNLSEAIKLCSEGLAIFRILKTPRENAMGTITAINLAFANGDYGGASKEWSIITGMFGEDLYFDRYPYLAWLHHRTISMIADRETRRKLLGKLIGILRHLTDIDWKETIWLMIMHERMARNQLIAAERICRRVSRAPSSILNYMPFRLQHVILKIYNEPDRDHLSMLDESFLTEMDQVTAMKVERSCLIGILSMKTSDDDYADILKSIETMPGPPAQIWTLSVLAYALERLGKTEAAADVRRIEQSARIRMASELPEDAKREFLSRKVIIRI